MTVKDVWMVAELRTALEMSQSFNAGRHYYDILRLQHNAVTVFTSGSINVPLKTYQGDGYRPYSHAVNALATHELNVTAQILQSSIGWVLLVDGSTKGAYSTKGDLMLFRAGLSF